MIANSPIRHGSANTTGFIKLLCVLLTLLTITGYTTPCQSATKEGTATMALRKLVDANPELKHLLIASIDHAKQINPDRKTNPVQSLDEYYTFVAWTEHAIPATIIDPRLNKTLFDRIDQGLCYFQFLSDQPLAELEGKGHFNNTVWYVPSYRAWLKTFVHSWGEFLNTPESWKPEYLQAALDDETFGLKNGWYEDSSRWTTFNLFFSRNLSSPDQRPIASRDDPSIVVSPVDAIPQGLWSIDKKSNLISSTGVAVKTATVQSIEELIGKNSQYKKAFAGGKFTHLFLNVQDYHHYHFPLDGVVKEIAIIAADEMPGGSVTWDPKNNRYRFDPSSVDYQSLETRGVVILDTEKYGLVGLLPIGMSPVSSVNFEPSLKIGSHVHKGDPMGYFLFGGSDFVAVFQAGYQFTLDSPKEATTHDYAHLLMGEKLGRLQRVSTAH